MEPQPFSYQGVPLTKKGDPPGKINNEEFDNLAPKLIDFLHPILGAIRSHQTTTSDPNNITLGDIGTLVGNILANTDMNKLSKLVSLTEK